MEVESLLTKFDMEKIKSDQNIQGKHGKNSGFIAIFILIITSLTVSSCSAIGEIFKAGMSFGIFIVVAIIVVVIILVLWFVKRKNS
jgi:cobalamin biosynthesis Mg chelatase CobN